jgi:ribosomal protein S18 acetylase RimI-like enzyme
MIDMLVKLYSLPDIIPLLEVQQEAGVTIRRAIAPEKFIITSWVHHEFGHGWASECEVAFCRQPVSCFTAIFNNKPVGFSCYDATCRGFFGPIGVHREFRSNGIGRALLLAALHAMSAVGYAYAIVGAAGPQTFFAKTVGATPIEGSSNGIYKSILR